MWIFVRPKYFYLYLHLFPSIFFHAVGSNLLVTAYILFELPLCFPVNNDSLHLT